jgi:F-type H+-transporting ATPase subunit gamma
MPTEESLKRKIASVEDHQSVVKTMKALAAASIRQYERAVESLAEYSRTVELGLQIVVTREPQVLSMLRPVSEGDRLAVVFGSDYGMAGQFNDQIADHVAQRIGKGDGGWTVWAVGERQLGRLERRGLVVEEGFSTPGSVNAITSAVQEILLRIEDWRSGRDVRQVRLFHNQPRFGASFEPREAQLLPVDRNWLRSYADRKWLTNSLPMFTMESAQLMSSLVRQYLFVTIYRALAESLASENASRLASMQAAEKNIAERLDELYMDYHRQRQSTITEELMDIIAGFEALTGDKR